MKTVSLNIDLGAGWRLVSVTQASVESKLVTLVLIRDGKTILTGFDIHTAVISDLSITFTSTQLHTIQTAISQYLK